MNLVIVYCRDITPRLGEFLGGISDLLAIQRLFAFICILFNSDTRCECCFEVLILDFAGSNAAIIRLATGVLQHEFVLVFEHVAIRGVLTYLENVGL